MGYFGLIPCREEAASIPSRKKNVRRRRRPGISLVEAGAQDCIFITYHPVLCCCACRTPDRYILIRGLRHSVLPGANARIHSTWSICHPLSSSDPRWQSLAPTVLLAAVVPRVLSVYRTFTRKLTDWENHDHQSSYDASLTIKTFALSAIVAYLGLALSAFVYVPFGHLVMGSVQKYVLRVTSRGDKNSSESLFDSDVHKALTKIDPSRESRLLRASGSLIINGTSSARSTEGDVRIYCYKPGRRHSR